MEVEVEALTKVGELAKAKDLKKALAEIEKKETYLISNLGKKKIIGASTSSVGQKKFKTVGFGIYTDQMNGSKILNPGTRGEKVVTTGVYKDATQTNIDIGVNRTLLKERKAKVYNII
ncbi:hypothetical protein P3L10_024738 [Capsicum annuum]